MKFMTKAFRHTEQSATIMMITWKIFYIFFIHLKVCFLENLYIHFFKYFRLWWQISRRFFWYHVSFSKLSRRGWMLNVERIAKSIYRSRIFVGTTFCGWVKSSFIIKDSLDFTLDSLFSAWTSERRTSYKV